MDWNASRRPLIIGHRGASADAPENTLAAFALALEQKADGVELDVRLTADQEVVVIHDSTIDRTTNGSGSVAAFTARELRDFDAGQEQTIPTLDEVFETFGPALLYNIEIKDFGWRDRSLEMAVADRVQAYHLERRVLISTFNPMAARRARKHFTRSTMIGLLRVPGIQGLVHLLFRAEADHPHFSMVNEAYMNWALRRNYRVHVWTVDDIDVAGQMARLGVHGIITNNPRQIRACLT